MAKAKTSNVDEKLIPDDSEQPKEIINAEPKNSEEVVSEEVKEESVVQEEITDEAEKTLIEFRKTLIQLGLKNADNLLNQSIPMNQHEVNTIECLKQIVSRSFNKICIAISTLLFK